MIGGDTDLGLMSVGFQNQDLGFTFELGHVPTLNNISSKDGVP